MPIIGWQCPACKRQVPLDHYEKTVCGKVIHPDYAAAVLHNDDTYYGTNTGLASVSSGLGCPRSRALESDTPVYINPLAYNAILIGSAWDTVMESGAVHVGDNTHKVQLTGEIAGVKLTGEIDRVREVPEPDGTTRLTIEDHKHGNNFQQKFVKAEGVKPAAVAQTSLYAELYAQQYGIRPVQGAIWYHFSGAPKAWPDSVVMPFFYELWDLARCLDFKPYDGSYTVAELLVQADSFERAKAAVLAGDSVDKATRLVGLATGLPLAGDTMKFRQTPFCDYCQVQAACKAAATGAPF